MRKRALLNGKDVNIDVDFFNEIGALPGTYRNAGSVGDYHRMNFTTPEGLFFAGWLETDNTIRVNCDDLTYADKDVAVSRLQILLSRLYSTDFQDITVRATIVEQEGEHPILRISFFQE